MHRLLFVTLMLLAGRAEAGGGFLPPLEIEVGGVDQAGDRDHPETFGTQVLVGLSWASVYPKRTPIDVTIGFEAVVPHVDPSTRVAREELMEPTASSQVGGYLDVGVALDRIKHLRTFVGGRGELLHGDAGACYGAVARMSVELWKPTFITGSGGGIIGTLAVGVWSEAGVRQRSDGSSGAVFATGLGFRVPLVAVR